MQPRHPFGDRPSYEDLIQDGDQIGSIPHATWICVEAGIICQLRPTKALAERSEQAVTSHRYDDVAVCASEHLIRDEVRVRISHPFRHTPGNQIIHVHVCERGDLHVEQRKVDMLSATGCIAVA